MAAEEMRKFAPAGTFVGIARLADHALELRRRSVRWGGGAADIVAARGGEVWGVLYELPDDQLGELDRKEGAGFAYRRRSLEVERDGGTVTAIAYEVIDKEPEPVPPTPEYAELLLSAAHERGLPAEYIARIEHSWCG